LPPARPVRQAMPRSTCSQMALEEPSISPTAPWRRGLRVFPECIRFHIALSSKAASASSTRHGDVCRICSCAIIATGKGRRPGRLAPARRACMAHSPAYGQCPLDFSRYQWILASSPWLEPAAFRLERSKTDPQVVTAREKKLQPVDTGVPETLDN
jgi:hypothetical protein